MDDVPAGPASPEPRRPSLSVVVPVRNGGTDFECCLRRLRDSSWTDFELIVVDDGSTDDSGRTGSPDGSDRGAARSAPRPGRRPQPRGPARLGALIFFLDADVAVYPGTLARGMTRFLADPSLTALFGSYDDRPPAPGVVSQFRNLLHHYVHQQGDFQDDTRPAHTFWTGCGMIRREVFLDFGGFDPRLYPRPAIEDIELGYRLTRAGHRIVLARDVARDAPQAVVARRDDPHRHLPPRRPLDAPDQAERDDRDRSQRQADPEAVRDAHRARPDGGRGVPARTGAGFVVALGSAAIVGLNRDFYKFLQATRGPALRGGRPAAPPALLHLLRRIGLHRPGSMALPAECEEGRRPRPGRADRPRRQTHSPALPGPGRTEAGTLDRTTKVAVIRTDRRRGGVAEALALIADDLPHAGPGRSRAGHHPEPRNPRSSLGLHASRHPLGDGGCRPRRGSRLGHHRE